VVDFTLLIQFLAMCARVPSPLPSYVEQLDRWFGLFSADHFLVLSLEGMRGDGGAATFAEVCRFVGVNAVGAGGFASEAALKVLRSNNQHMHTRRTTRLKAWVASFTKAGSCTHAQRTDSFNHPQLVHFASCASLVQAFVLLP